MRHRSLRAPPPPLLLLLLLLMLLVSATTAANAADSSSKPKRRKQEEQKTDSSCGVCLDIINSIVDMSMPDVRAKPKEQRLAAAVSAIDMYCSHSNRLHTSERRMCSYLEPLQTVAAKALVMKMRSDRICKKLNKENPDVCSLVTLSKQEHSAMSMRRSNQQALTAAEYLLTVDPDFLIPLTPQQKRELLYQFERGTVMI